MQDGVSFFHVVETDTGAAPFAHLPCYNRFRSTVETRCTEPPTMVSFGQIGSYRDDAAK
jgi:hypothetical protein